MQRYPYPRKARNTQATARNWRKLRKAAATGLGLRSMQLCMQIHIVIPPLTRYGGGVSNEQGRVIHTAGKQFGRKDLHRPTGTAEEVVSQFPNTHAVSKSK